jgi:hypothetical protein
MARALPNTSQDGVDLAKVTWSSPMEPAGFVLLSMLMGGMFAVLQKAKDKAIQVANEISEIAKILQPFAATYFSYETVQRSWVNNPDPNARRRGRLEWRPQQPLNDLGPAVIWAGTPLQTLDGMAIVKRMKALGYEFKKEDEAALAQDHKSRVAASLRIGQNAERGNNNYAQYIHPSPWVENADRDVYRTSVLGQKTGATAGVGATSAGDIDGTGHGDDTY